MRAIEAKKKLYEMLHSNLTDNKQKEAIGVAIRAIETCERAYIII